MYIKNNKSKYIYKKINFNKKPTQNIKTHYNNIKIIQKYNWLSHDTAYEWYPVI